jgi:hypothetical protein
MTVNGAGRRNMYPNSQPDSAHKKAIADAAAIA